MKLTKKIALSIEEILTTDLVAGKETRDKRLPAFRLVDSYMEKTSAKHKEATQGKQVNEAGDKSKTRDIEIPICFIQHETALASMTGTFLGGEPIFAATSGREHEDAAAMLTVLSQRDQHRFRWRGQLIQCMDDALRYNVCGALVRWQAKRTTNVETQAGESNAHSGVASAVTYEGNEIKRLDPYNLILDPSVPPNEVHEHGMYAGYVEAKNRMSYEKFVSTLDTKFLFREGLVNSRAAEPAWDMYVERTFYGYTTTKDANDFTGFWGAGKHSNRPKSGTDAFEVVHLYARIIPFDFGIDVPNPHSVQVFYMVWANGKLIYIEPFTTGLEFLPIIVGCRYYGGINKKSFVEYITDLQDIATSMTHGGLNAMRRAVADRALYDPTRISKAAIESPNPVEKIAVNANAFGTPISESYYQVPFNDTVSPQFTSMLGFTMSLADQTLGQNQSSQGNFIKGNKTLFEFDTIMSNAEGRTQLGKIVFNETFMAPIQEILKINYLVYSQNEAIDNGTDAEPIEIDPVLLREVAPNFLMADGILPTTKIANSEIALQAIQLLGMDPKTAIEYDIGALMISILKQEGLTKINEYKRSPEEMQQYMQMMQAMAPQPQQNTPQGGQE